MAISCSVAPSCCKISSQNSGARSAGPIGWCVTGCSGGAGGCGRTGTMLNRPEGSRFRRGGSWLCLPWDHPCESFAARRKDVTLLLLPPPVVRYAPIATSGYRRSSGMTIKCGVAALMLSIVLGAGCVTQTERVPYRPYGPPEDEGVMAELRREFGWQK